MDTGRTVACLLAVVLLAGSPVAAATVQTRTGVAATAATADATADVDAGAASAVRPDRVVAAQSVDPDTVLLRADVAADGTARWRIEYLVRLDDRNTTDAFESVATDIENDPTQFTDRFTDRMRRTVRAAENATGREMAVENVTVETARQDLGAEYGVVRYDFTWTNFAAADETNLRIGDALGGFFLDAETQLTVTWPEAYTLASVSPAPAEQSATEVVWQGRQSFSSSGPRVVASTTATTTRQGSPSGPGGGSSGASGTTLLVVAIVAALVALTVAYAVTQRRGDDEGAVVGTDETGTGGAAGAAAAAGDERAADDGGETGDTDDDPPEELLSNEERVLKLLEDRGGRIKQQEIAGELDWTDAKTSQVVKGLREDDDVEVFRLGRENVVTLPDEGEL